MQMMEGVKKMRPITKASSLSSVLRLLSHFILLCVMITLLLLSTGTVVEGFVVHNKKRIQYNHLGKNNNNNNNNNHVGGNGGNNNGNNNNVRPFLWNSFSSDDGDSNNHHDRKISSSSFQWMDSDSNTSQSVSSTSSMDDDERRMTLPTAITNTNKYTSNMNRFDNENNIPSQNHYDHCMNNSVSIIANITSRCVRGGGPVGLKKQTSQPTIVSPIQGAIQYWTNAVSSALTKVTEPFHSVSTKVSNILSPKDEEEILMKQLQTMPIKKVIVPDTKVLPKEVIDIASKNTIVGNPLRTSNVQDFAQSIRRWYIRNGYLLHSVTGATLNPETATAEIQVQEPVVSSIPVGITFVKEMIVDPNTGQLLTPRQYKEKMNSSTNSRTFGFKRDTFNTNNKKKNSIGATTSQLGGVNTTFIATTGRTIPNRIASALRLYPGQPFRWDDTRWHQIRSCGIFSKILRASPQPMEDGTVQFHIITTESPSRHLEYGVGKSLYTGIWEGEIDFEHKNVWGGGETIGISIRRQATQSGTFVPSIGTSSTTQTNKNNNNHNDSNKNSNDMFNVQPSVHIKYSDGRFKTEGGYDIEIFRDYFGGQINNAAAVNNKESTKKKMKISNNKDNWRDRKEEIKPMKQQEEQQLQTLFDKESNIVGPAIATSTSPVATEEEASIRISDLTHQPQPDMVQAPVQPNQQVKTMKNYNNDDEVLLDRKGATIRLNNPIDPLVIRNSVVSASIEQTSSVTNKNEIIGSTSWELGPFFRELPIGARSNFDFTITAGTRIFSSSQQAQRRHHHPTSSTQHELTPSPPTSAAAAGGTEADNIAGTILSAPLKSSSQEDRSNSNGNSGTRGILRWLYFGRGGSNDNDDDNDGTMENLRHHDQVNPKYLSSTILLPYSSITATTRQIFPFLGDDGRSNNASIRPRKQRRPLLLAFRHSVIASTPNLPRHVMQAHGTASTIRGYSSTISVDGGENTYESSSSVARVSSALQGTVELRVPVQIPSYKIQRSQESKIGILVNKQLNEDIIQDGSVVVFTDWVLTTKDWESKACYRSCFGLGLRKSIQGIPIYML